MPEIDLYLVKSLYVRSPYESVFNLSNKNKSARNKTIGQELVCTLSELI